MRITTSDENRIATSKTNTELETAGVGGEGAVRKF